MADTEAILRQTLNDRAGTVAAPPDLLPRVHAVSQRRRNTRLGAVMASAAVATAVGVAGSGLTSPAGEDRIGTVAASQEPSEPCLGGRMGQAVLEGPAAEELAEQLRVALAGRWKEDRDLPPCQKADPGYSPFGGQVRRSAAVPFEDSPDIPPTLAVLVEHEEPTSEAVAEEYARVGGPTRIVLGPGQTLAPDLVFDNRLITESRPDGSSHIWVYETLQTVIGVLWTSDGLTAMVLAVKGGDADPQSLGSDVEQALAALVGEG